MSSVKGYSDVLVGLQYGDEGKARIIDMLAKNYSIIARFNGGPNAGHTIETDKGKIALHQIPSGVFYPDKELYIGSGCVVNLEKLVVEMNDLAKLGITINDRLHISSQASLIQPHHILIDIEAGKKIGTTGNGIGPAYADRAMRINGDHLLNVRVGDLLVDFDATVSHIRENLKNFSMQCGQNNSQADKVMVESLVESFKTISPFIERDTLYLDAQIRNGKNVLFEGAQSFMLDVVKGTVPFVTSSQTVAGHAYVGGDLSPSYHRKTIGVAKVIMSRVGNGPFVSELGGRRSEDYCMQDGGKTHGKATEANLVAEEMLHSHDPFKVGIALRVLGNEYGASTGRPRRIGILDIVQLAYAVRINGVDEIYLNKCDMLKDFANTFFTGIPIVNDYIFEDKRIDYVPGSVEEYRKVVPVVCRFKSFDESISTVCTYSGIPEELNYFLAMIEHRCGCHVAGIGVGPAREQYIKMPIGGLEEIFQKMDKYFSDPNLSLIFERV